MNSFNDLNGIPATGNRYLQRDILKGEWGFKGFVLSDLGAIRKLYDSHHVAASPREAVWLTINSGVDMQFFDFDHDVWEGAIIEGVKALAQKEPT